MGIVAASSDFGEKRNLQKFEQLLSSGSKMIGMRRCNISDVLLNSKAILMRPWLPALMWYVRGSFILQNIVGESSLHNEFDK